MNAQRDESDVLRRQIEAAGQVAMLSSTSAAEQLQQAIDEEQAQSAHDREQLLAQISSLISDHASKQESRVAARTEAVREQIAASKTALQGGLDAYAKGMDAWNTAADDFVADASKSRDALKLRLQEDWAVSFHSSFFLFLLFCFYFSFLRVPSPINPQKTANDHSTSIQNTTKSIHAETVRVVDEQMEDLDVKMQDLDSLVRRAETRSNEHVAEHTESVAKMADIVTATFAELSAHAQDTIGRGETLMEETEAKLEEQRSGLAPTEETLCQPLGDLRAHMTSTALSEYVPTGSTPEKIQYQYPLDLPRTAPRAILVASLRNKGSSRVIKQEDVEGGDEEAVVVDGNDAEDIGHEHDNNNNDGGDVNGDGNGGDNNDNNEEDDFQDELLDTVASPSKPPANCDTTAAPVIYSDQDAAGAGTGAGVSLQSPLSKAGVPMASLASLASLTSPIPSIPSNPSLNMSLRELSPNRSLGSGSSSSLLSSLAGDLDKSSSVVEGALVAAAAAGAPATTTAKSAATTKPAASTTTATSRTASSTASGHSLPVYRRRSLRQTHGPPPAKQAKTRTSVMALEGRENMPPSAYAQSLARRRSPRLK